MYPSSSLFVLRDLQTTLLPVKPNYPCQYTNFVFLCISCLLFFGVPSQLEKTFWCLSFLLFKSVQLCFVLVVVCLNFSSSKVIADLIVLWWLSWVWIDMCGYCLWSWLCCWTLCLYWVVFLYLFCYSHHGSCSTRLVNFFWLFLTDFVFPHFLF